MSVDEPKPLRRHADFVSGILRAVVGLVVLTFVLSLVDPRIGWGWAGTDTCVTADWISGVTGHEQAAFDAYSGARVDAVPHYCAGNPTGGQALLHVLMRLPAFVLVIGGLALLNRTLSKMSRCGVYTVQAVSAVTWLGWWVLAGCLIGTGASAAAKAALLATLTSLAPLSFSTLLHSWSPPCLGALIGLALLAFARTVKEGVSMREDLEGVI